MNPTVIVAIVVVVIAIIGFCIHLSNNIVRLGNRCDNAWEAMAANNQLTGALRQLFALSESYPDLKANANFQQLQAQLEETENKIVYARQSFNDCVLMYNNAIQTFPGSLFAGGRAPKHGFEISDADSQVPQVKF